MRLPLGGVAIVGSAGRILVSRDMLVMELSCGYGVSRSGAICNRLKSYWPGSGLGWLTRSISSRRLMHRPGDEKMAYWFTAGVVSAGSGQGGFGFRPGCRDGLKCSGRPGLGGSRPSCGMGGPIVTVNAFASLHGLDPSLVQRWCESGRLQAARVAGGWAIRTTRRNADVAQRQERAGPTVVCPEAEKGLWKEFEKEGGCDLLALARTVGAKLSSVQCAWHRWGVMRCLDQGYTISEVAAMRGVTRQGIARLMKHEPKI